MAIKRSLEINIKAVPTKTKLDVDLHTKIQDITPREVTETMWGCFQQICKSNDANPYDMLALLTYSENFDMDKLIRSLKGLSDYLDAKGE